MFPHLPMGPRAPISGRTFLFREFERTGKGMIVNAGEPVSLGDPQGDRMVAATIITVTRIGLSR